MYVASIFVSFLELLPRTFNDQMNSEVGQVKRDANFKGYFKSFLYVKLSGEEVNRLVGY